LRVGSSARLRASPRVTVTARGRTYLPSPHTDQKQLLSTGGRSLCASCFASLAWRLPPVISSLVCVAPVELWSLLTVCASVGADHWCLEGDLTFCCVLGVVCVTVSWGWGVMLMPLTAVNERHGSASFLSATSLGASRE
jgi:hypothetical protein